MPMNPEFPRKLAAILRTGLQAEAENQILRGMLALIQSHQATAEKWEEALETSRLSLPYRNIAESCDPQLLQLESASDVMEVQRLLDTMPSTRISN